MIGGRDEAKLKRAAADIDPTGTRGRTAAGDIARPATAAALVNVATEAFGGVDILFLASTQASWIAGSVLPVDGGVMAGRQA